MKILVIEDDDHIREGLLEILEDEGFETGAARNGTEGLERLTEARSREALPGLILLDLTMPIMDGAEFLARRESLGWLAGIPVIVMSARDEEAMAAGTGVLGCIRKPIDLDRLLALIRKVPAAAPGE